MEKLAVCLGRVLVGSGPKCVGHSRLKTSFAEPGFRRRRAMSDTTTVARLRRHRNTATLTPACSANHADFGCFQRIDTDRFLADGTLRCSDEPFGVSFLRH